MSHDHELCVGGTHPYQAPEAPSGLGRLHSFATGDVGPDADASCVAFAIARPKRVREQEQSYRARAADSCIWAIAQASNGRGPDESRRLRSGRAAVRIRALRPRPTLRACDGPGSSPWTAAPGATNPVIALHRLDVSPGPDSPGSPGSVRGPGESRSRDDTLTRLRRVTTSQRGCAEHCSTTHSVNAASIRAYYPPPASECRGAGRGGRSPSSLRDGGFRAKGPRGASCNGVGPHEELFPGLGRGNAMKLTGFSRRLIAAAALAIAALAGARR